MAAGVTDRLWDIGDIVDMLESWETKEKRGAQPIFEAVQNKIGGDWFVRATLANAVPEQIYGFKTEGEAVQWIRNESLVWLNERRVKLAVNC